MSKRKRTPKVDKWIKEDRGTGSGADYQPWFKVQDVSSLGRSMRLIGIKTNRQYNRTYVFLKLFYPYISIEGDSFYVYYREVLESLQRTS
ncbi:transposase [Amphibacillus sediminis]|uniref:transposase n=1 Tax=Amphibacillus sediminis TaxID=360185 RepID=UPI001FE022CB|nr:transposase [Amphibacillus sediminis]